MSININSVVIAGRVGADPEIKSPNKKTLATFSVATNESYKDKHDEWQNKAVWHRIIEWGRIAETAERLPNSA